MSPAFALSFLLASTTAPWKYWAQCLLETLDSVMRFTS